MNTKYDYDIALGNTKDAHFEYIYNALSSYSKKIFTDLISHIRGGKVLDLGCGWTGHYWLLGYIERAESISLYDYDEKNVALLSGKINDEVLTEIEKFSGTITFLQQKELLSTITKEDIAMQLVERVQEIKTFDFLKPNITKKFNYIFSLEALQCVANNEEMETAFKTCYDLLEKEGMLLATLVMKKEINEKANNLISIKLDGSYIFSEDTVTDTLEKVGFTNITTSMYEIPVTNYEKVLFVIATKP